jgi:hypothetical protein
MSTSDLIVAALIALVALAGPALLPGKHRANVASVEQVAGRNT